MTHALDWTDGVETYRYKEEDGRLYRLHTSNEEDAILQQNAAVRASGGARRLAWGRQVASLPLATWEVLVKLHPGLVSRDPNERFRSWERFARNSDYYKLTTGG